MVWHSVSGERAVRELKSDSQNGLSVAEARARLAKFGENKLNGGKNFSPIKRFFAQFSDFCVIILFVACMFSFLTSLIGGDGNFVEPIVILFIVVMNAVVGVLQEYRAERALEALKKLSAPAARTARSGKIIKIPAAELTPGDVILLESGDTVPADARLLSANGLKVQESALTGESEPSEKYADAVYPENFPLADRKNFIFSSSTVVAGNCRAVVTETGMNAAVGKIARLLAEEKTPLTPLQRRLEKTGKKLGIGALCICALVFVLGTVKNTDVMQSFMLAVSLAVAAIPEGLPATVAVVLSMGVRRTAKSNAIIRRLPAVETLGAATVVCSDKTGTLTQNKMKAAFVCSAAGELKFSSPEARKILLLGSICNNSQARLRGKTVFYNGDPTETAILAAAFEAGEDVFSLKRSYPRLSENPFSSERKLMSTLNRTPEGEKLIVKGAPDVVINKCSEISIGGSRVPITDFYRKRIEKLNADAARGALRVVAVAWRKADSADVEEKNLVFVGLIGMTDPPRPEAAGAVSICKRAGITPVMITGDHVSTARAVAERLGILEEGRGAMTGAELDETSDAQLVEKIDSLRVFARVSPEHKVRIVKAFQARGEIVAMTGDGVNDAPALKAADIGCAMGRSGVDVAKNAADMILTDDNFATIVKAVELGRGIYDNIKKAVRFLIGTNIGEILTVFVSSLFNFAPPLVPIQLLWINLVTDSLPAMALGTEKVDAGVMNRKPISPKSGFFSGGAILDVVLEGFLVGALAILAYSIGRFAFGTGENVVLGRTMTFCVLSFSEIAYAVNARSPLPLFKAGFFSNAMMNVSVAVGVALQSAVVLIPGLANIFGVVPMTPVQWLLVAALSAVPLAAGEIGKTIVLLAPVRRREDVPRRAF